MRASISAALRLRWGERSTERSTKRKGRAAPLIKQSRGACTRARAISRQYGRTPLHDACWYGHKEIAEQLVEEGADIK